MKTLIASTTTFVMGIMLALLVSVTYIANTAPNVIDNAICSMTTDSSVDYGICKFQTAFN